jgi:predicted nucleic acid-binding Zn ribbon protein
MRADARFCSAACRTARQRWVAVGRPRTYARSETFDGVERQCEHCGGRMGGMGLDVGRADQRFCSTRCRVAAHRAARRGPAAPRVVPAPAGKPRRPHRRVHREPGVLAGSSSSSG